MIKRLFYWLYQFAFKFGPLSLSEYLTTKLSGSYQSAISVQEIANKSLGIGDYSLEVQEGEIRVLGELFGGQEKRLTIFDVGSNTGQYASTILKIAPSCLLHCFEPNPKAFGVLQDKIQQKAFINNFALSSQETNAELFVYKNDLTTEHGAINKSVLEQLESSSNIISFEIVTKTLDSYCLGKDIVHIDLLKIDTEGHELDVLKGAGRMLDANAVNYIQFEFNTMNVQNKIFMVDFFRLLKGFDFYRIQSNRLVPLKTYQVVYEQFQYQNILAVNRLLNKSW